MVVGTEHADRTGSDVVIRRSEVETIQSVKKYISDWQFKTYTHKVIIHKVMRSQLFCKCYK